MKSNRKYDLDMTQGSAFKHILLFALPLLMGNIFQQLYNTVDTWVVGNYVSDAAFSAVGTVAPIINMLIGAFSGLASGAGVVISQYYGAKDEQRAQDTVHTAVALTIVLTIALTLIGILMTPLMLRFTRTPEDVFPESRTYLTIYFAGMAGLLFYNMGSGILRAIGDSRRPFYYLVAAAVLNTILDLVFVIQFHMGVAGVAYATIIAQAISATLTMITLFTSRECVRVRWKKLRFHAAELRKIVMVGIPASLQMAVTAFSNVFVQSYINQFGKFCMGGWTAYTKADAFIFMPMQSLALAATTFVGQNLGSGKPERAKKGARTALLTSLGITAVICVIVMIFAEPIVRFFNSTPEVVEYGKLFLTRITPFYILCCVNQVYSGALRGSGNSKAPMIIMLMSFVVFRQVYLFVVSNYICNEILPLAMGYPAGWLLCSICTFIYYERSSFEDNRLLEKGARK